METPTYEKKEDYAANVIPVTEGSDSEKGQAYTGEQEVFGGGAGEVQFQTLGWIK
jgi:hypothetical protein